MPATHPRGEDDRHQRLIPEVSELCGRIRDPHAVIQAVTSVVASALGVSRCGFSVIDIAAGTASVIADHHGALPSLAGEHPLTAYATNFEPQALAGGVINFEDTFTDSRSAADVGQFQALGVRAHLVVPLCRSGEWVAAFWVAHHAPRRWTSGDVDLLKVIGDRVWAVVERHDAEEALRESQLQFHALADSMPQLVWATDASGNVEYINGRWFEYTGQIQEAAQGNGWLSVMHPEDLPHMRERWRQAVDFGEPYEVEYRLRARSGEYRWFLARAVAQRDKAGYLTGWFGTSTDIDDQKRIVNALQDSQAKLERAQEELHRTNTELEQKVSERTTRLRESIAELEHFSYTITHDMRAPLRAMQSFAELLRDEYRGQFDATATDYLRRIIEAAARMDGLITDSLNYAKAVQTELRLTPIDPGPLLRSILESYPEFRPPRAHVEIATEFPAILGNAAGLTQCFSNLIGNAVKFVAPGTTPRLRIWGEERIGAVRLWFEDNGIGIPPEHQDRVFIMFQRLSKNYEGTGVGLALVRKVMSKMRGDVGVESNPSGGSRFWLELEAVPRNGAAAKAARS